MHENSIFFLSKKGSGAKSVQNLQTKQAKKRNRRQTFGLRLTAKAVATQFKISDIKTERWTITDNYFMFFIQLNQRLTNQHNACLL